MPPTCVWCIVCDSINRSGNLDLLTSFGLPWPFCSRVRSRHATDRQTGRRTSHHFIMPRPCGGFNNSTSVTFTLWIVLYIIFHSCTDGEKCTWRRMSVNEVLMMQFSFDVNRSAMVVDSCDRHRPVAGGSLKSHVFKVRLHHYQHHFHFLYAKCECSRVVWCRPNV